MDPSSLPTRMSPVVLTRQLFHPSLNFLDPISTVTLDPGSLIRWNRESARSLGAAPA